MRVAIWVFYVLPVVLCVWADRPAVPIVTAALSSTLMIAGYALAAADPNANLEVLQINRAMGVVVLLVLAAVAHLYIKSRLAVQRTTWLQQGIVQLGVKLRGEQSPASIGVSILRSIIPYVNAKVGVVYALDGDALVRVAAWALPDEGSAPARIARGEGLVGQAIEEGRVLELRDASAHYLKAGSALGSAAASRVLIAPLHADGDVAGAIELGFVGGEGRFDDARALLDMASEPIGMALRSSRYRARLVELLEQTQRQSEELQVQQEELRVSNEELEERGRALQDSQARLEQQQAELEQTNVQLEEHTQHLERQKAELMQAQQELTANSLEMEREPVQVGVPREHVARTAHAAQQFADPREAFAGQQARQSER
jgi:hypothetical protein